MAIKYIQMLKEELQGIVNCRMLISNKTRKKELTDQIETLWRQEEMYQGLRSRIDGITWGIETQNSSMPLQSKEDSEIAYHC